MRGLRAGTAIIIIFLIQYCAPKAVNAAVKRWNGTVSSNWSDPENWSPSGVPAEVDDIVLDNTYRNNDYSLKGSDSSVNIASLEISPTAGFKITFIIPPSNKQVPALNFLAAANSLVLNSGAVLINSSGLTSGQSILIGGRFVIWNGATYIHNTRASHATGIIAKLSTDPGTEKGLFVFDVPGGAYSLSLSNRNYGSLRLSANASDGTQTYNATGTSITNIRGDLEINTGVVFNLDLERTLTIGGDFLQKGGVFNLASQANNLQIVFKGFFIQDSSGVITETSTGLPSIVFEGTGSQLVSVRGAVLNSVSFTVNNPYGIILNADFPVSYTLQMKSGNIRSFKNALVKVADNATILNASVNSFVDGPIQKTGDEDFEYPVGKQGDYAPVKISGTGRLATEKYIVEYHHGNPQLDFGNNISAPSILRISSLEYWTVEKSANGNIEKISLAVGPYSHATSLEKLNITSWDKSHQTWINIGNTASSGISSGTITSEPAIINGIFTIGTTVADQNPLPVYFERLKGKWLDNQVILNWKAFNQGADDQYRIDFSDDGLVFHTENIFDADPSRSDCVFATMMPAKTITYARVSLIAGGEKEVQSQTILVKKQKPRVDLHLYPSPAKDYVNVRFDSPSPGPVWIDVFDRNGRIVIEQAVETEPGMHIVRLNISSLRSGYYYCRVRGSGWFTVQSGFLKKDLVY